MSFSEKIESEPSESKPDPRPPRKLLGNHHFTVLELYVRCERVYRKPITSFSVAYSKELCEKKWLEVARSDPVSDSTFPNYRQWDYRKVGTEITEALKFEFSFESTREIRIEVYKVRDKENLVNLSEQKFLGSAEISLGHAFLMQGRAEGGWVMKKMQHHRGDDDLGHIVFHCREDFLAKQFSSLTVKGSALRKTSFWKWKSDPYMIMSRTNATSSVTNTGPKGGRAARLEHMKSNELKKDAIPERVAIFRSEVKRATNPRWDNIYMSTSALCQGKKTLLIEVEVRDWMRIDDHPLIGRCTFTYDDMEKSFRDTKPLVLELSVPRTELSLCPKRSRKNENVAMFDRLLRKCDSNLGAHTVTIGKKPVAGFQCLDGIHGGSVEMSVGIGRYFSFYDYVRGGLELRLCVGIDFTRSNQGPENLTSHHRFGGNGPNDYTKAMRMVTQVVQQYDSEKSHVIYGFGAKLPPSYPSAISNCFAMTGDFFSPRVDGVEGLEDAYQRALHIVFLHGPSSMRSVIKVAMEWALASSDVHQVNDNGVEMRYWISLILTDGEITDQAECLQEFVHASNLPISFMIVGIGDGKFEWFESLNSEVQQIQGVVNKEAEEAYSPPPITQRKVVHFVRFNDFKGKPETEFAGSLMGDLPRVVLEFYQSMDLRPWNLANFEHQSGQLFPVPIIDRTKENAMRNVAMRRAQLNTAVSGRLRNPSKPKADPWGKAEDKSEQDIFTRAVLMRELAAQETIKKLPEFLVQARERLLEEANSYGYGRETVKRVLAEGIPEGKIEVLLDTLLHGGYGKRPIYKTMAAEIDLEKEARKQAMKTLLRNSGDASITAPPGQPAPLKPLPDDDAASKGLRTLDTRNFYPSIKDNCTNSQICASFKTSNSPQFNVSASPSVYSSPWGSSPRHETVDEQLSDCNANDDDYDAHFEIPAELPGAVVAKKSSYGACTICYELCIDTELRPCGHRIICQLCAEKVGVICPLCRQTIKEVVCLDDLIV